MHTCIDCPPNACGAEVDYCNANGVSVVRRFVGDSPAPRVIRPGGGINRQVVFLSLYLFICLLFA